MANGIQTRLISSWGRDDPDYAASDLVHEIDAALEDIDASKVVSISHSVTLRTDGQYAATGIIAYRE